jgi:hypothetical protein
VRNEPFRPPDRRAHRADYHCLWQVSSPRNLVSLASSLRDVTGRAPTLNKPA